MTEKFCCMSIPAKAGALVLVLAMAVVWMALDTGRSAAQAINPKVFKEEFDKAKKDADVVAKVRVLAAVCSEKAGAGKEQSVTLEVSLQVLDAEKGAKKNNVLVVSHKVNLPSGPGPGSYGYQSALRKFPFTPGVRGDVALRWDKERREYTAIAGWVEEPNNADIPKEVGKAMTAGDKGN